MIELYLLTFFGTVFIGLTIGWCFNLLTVDLRRKPGKWRWGKNALYKDGWHD